MERRDRVESEGIGNRRGELGTKRLRPVGSDARADAGVMAADRGEGFARRRRSPRLRIDQAVVDDQQRLALGPDRLDPDRALGVEQRSGHAKAREDLSNV